MNGIRPAAYAGCIGINGDRQGIGGTADVEVAAPVINIWGSNGGRKKSGFGKGANWAADGTGVAAAAAAAAAAAGTVLVDVDDELASDDDSEDSLVDGFSFSPYNNHTTTHTTDFNRQKLDAQLQYINKCTFTMSLTNSRHTPKSISNIVYWRGHQTLGLPLDGSNKTVNHKYGCWSTLKQSQHTDETCLHHTELMFGRSMYVVVYVKNLKFLQPIKSCNIIVIPVAILTCKKTYRSDSNNKQSGNASLKCNLWSKFLCFFVQSLTSFCHRANKTTDISAVLTIPVLWPVHMSLTFSVKAEVTQMFSTVAASTFTTVKSQHTSQCCQLAMKPAASNYYYIFFCSRSCLMALRSRLLILTQS